MPSVRNAIRNNKNKHRRLNIENKVIITIKLKYAMKYTFTTIHEDQKINHSFLILFIVVIK